MSQPWCSAFPGGVRLAFHVQPNARKTEAVGLHDDALKLKLAAPPVDGKANEALVKFLSESLGVPRSAVTLTHGHTARRKLFEVRGVSQEQAVAALLPAQA
jgi:uncharacterized protein (TIGR00251 family)